MKRKPALPHQHELLRMEGEVWLCARLAHHGAAVVFDGLTTTAQRLEEIRKIILRFGLESVIVGGAKRGKPETYAEVFERLYGQPLITPAMRAKARELRQRRA